MICSQNMRTKGEMMFDSDERSAGEAETHNDNATVQSSEVASVGSTRYRGKAMSWLAFGALLAAWHMQGRVERPQTEGSTARVGSPRGADHPPARRPQQLWITRATEARSWIARAPHGVARSVSTVLDMQPDFSSLASVRTARRWLKTL